MSDDIAKLQLQLDEARAFQRLTSAALNDELARAKFDLIAHLERQRQFSEQTFGPGDASDRFAGLSDHIKKELLELEREPMCLEEWIDVVLIGLDGAWRTGASSAEIAKALEAKQAKNEKREWPDWRTVPKGTAIEHVRSQGFTEADYVAQVERLSKGLELARAERNALAAEVERLKTGLAAVRELNRAADEREAVTTLQLVTERDEARAEVESLAESLTERNFLLTAVERERDEARAEACGAIGALLGERDEWRRKFELEKSEVERLQKLVDAYGPHTCEAHHGVRRACGQCLDSARKLARSVAKERDEARAEVERLIEDAENYVADADLCANCRDEVSAIGHSLRAEATHRAECAAVDPKPTPPVDVPDLGPRSPADLTGERPTPPERPRAKHVEQPMPAGNGAEVFRVAIAECPSPTLAEALKAREAIGIERYGTTLRTHNGRDVVRDLREEIADGVAYCTQAILEGGRADIAGRQFENAREKLMQAWSCLSPLGGTP